MAEPVEGRDARDVKRVMRRLGLVESHQSFEGWYAQVSGQLPEASMREFEKNHRGSRVDYGLNYQDFDHARLLHVSWRSHALEMEIAWMLPRLREALASVMPERRFLVELGAGHGAAAAVISAVLKVPVITVDPEPAALGLPEQFAARTGGVTSRQSLQAHRTFPMRLGDACRRRFSVWVFSAIFKLTNMKPAPSRS